MVQKRTKELFIYKRIKMKKNSLTNENLIEVLKKSHTIAEASKTIYGNSERKYKQAIRRFCEKNNIDYNNLFLPQEEKHYYCKYCGKEILGKDRAKKKFCCRSCSASFNNTNRKHTEEEKIKISHSLQRRNPSFNGIYKEIEKNQHKNYETFDKRKEYFCSYCGKKIENPYASKTNRYCSNECRYKHKRVEYIERWKNGEENGLKGKYQIATQIRDYLLEKVNYKCEKCGFSGVNPYTNNTILQIHHIDGDSSNNKEENLQVLCPNCHAMTDNFGSRNKNATKGRTQYFGKDKY
jgi:5-methylcytosine-specific restriction endonuclease McrA